MKIRVYLVDDEPLARARLISLLKAISEDIDIVGESGRATDAIDEINDLKPDVVLLDIEMPLLDGFDVVSMLREPRPYIIFVTAYDNYAIRAFEVYALDYLTKPVRLERLRQSLHRIRSVNKENTSQHGIEKALKEREKKPLNVLTGKKGRKVRIIDLNDVLYIMADDKLLHARLKDASYRVDGTLSELEDRIAGDRFIRVHRSHLVNIMHIKEFVPWFSGSYELIMTNKEKIRVSRRRVPAVKEALGIT